MRLNKYIAHSGYCTRREASTLIKAGKVTIDNVVVDNPGHEVTDEQVVKADGLLISEYEANAYYLINKGKKTRIAPDEHKRHLLLSIKNNTYKRLQIAHPLLDTHTGLHLVTNDQALLDRLARQSETLKCVYHLKTARGLTPEQIDAYVAADEQVRSLMILPESINDADAAYNLVLEGGVKVYVTFAAYCAELDIYLDRVDRIYYGGLTKKDLSRDWSRPLTQQEIVMMKHFS